MHRPVEPREAGVVTEAVDDLQRVLVLRVNRPWPDMKAVVAVNRADLGDQRHELLLQLVEDRPNLRRLHARLEVVEQDVIGLVEVVEALDVAAPQLDRVLEVGEELRYPNPAAPWPRSHGPRRPHR